MWFETQYQIVPVDMPLSATARRIVNPDVEGLFAIDGFLPDAVALREAQKDPSVQVPLLPFKRVNYVSLTFYGRPDHAGRYDPVEGPVICRLTVIDVSTLTDAIAALDDDVLNFILAGGVCGIRALVHIQEA